MLPTADSLVMIAASWPILIAGVLLIGLFAPHLLPKIGRMLGRTIRGELFRRVGLPTRVASSLRSSTQAAYEPPPQTPEERYDPIPTQPNREVRVESLQSFEPVQTRGITFWLVGAGVFVAAGLIFWLLLHAR